MNYKQTDPIMHSIPENQQETRHRRNLTEIGSTYDKLRQSKAENPILENSVMSRGSLNRSVHPEDSRTAAFSDKIAQEEKDSKVQQKALLGQELVKQLKEKEMFRDIENEKVRIFLNFSFRNREEYTKMKAEENHMKSIENLIKRNEMTSQKNLLDEYQNMIKQKLVMKSIERDDEKKTAQNYNEVAKNSLTQEGTEKRKQLDRFKVELKQDYQDRLKYIESQRFNKLKEQEEYRNLFDQNSKREIANEYAYKQRFKNYDSVIEAKKQQFNDIINNHDYQREQEAKKIGVFDKYSFYDYYDQREKDKLRKTEELKENSYKDMKNTIDRNYRSINEMGKKNRIKAEQSAQELQQFLDDEKQRRVNDRMMRQQYRGILDTQVKIK